MDHATRALADHLAGTGKPGRAAQMYALLLKQITASGADPRNDLRYAVKLSSIYDVLAELHRRIGELPVSESYLRQRIDLWRHWEGKLPGNAFVRARSMEAGGASSANFPLQSRFPQ
jgi:hypothetical protein